MKSSFRNSILHKQKYTLCINVAFKYEIIFQLEKLSTKYKI